MQIELWPAGGERRWRLVTDAVMGGVSRGTLQATELHGRLAARMRGAVSTENNGGFIQIAMDLAPDGGAYDAGGFTGVGLEVAGNGERYGVHLRTTDMLRPQQSYRESFVTSPEPAVVQLPFGQFVPHRIETPLNLARLRRIGLVAIGRAFDADLSVMRLWLY
ncbi:conserved hypothetical protein [Rhodopseudomonas palustris HaA2]|uniref:NADH:ubiquinone oxidoreductase intermediate-associated protein 30 domain-containing protein n=1 Tax=Rhodopseudomonas palustris (strain HaA2) TaxID=316058 RepID=Q2ISU6_RHOP2|nr:CIA30 family protein [Rhodopseudomonas palustris]ABD08714.1 conserved hypothetical protein [Rhodopseudomonas palustris HaA2]